MTGKAQIFFCIFFLVVSFTAITPWHIVSAAGNEKQDYANIQIAKNQILAGKDTVNIPQVTGMTDDKLQSLINLNLKEKIMSFSNPEPNSSLHGDFDIIYYNRSLLGINFKGYSYTNGTAHPNKIDTVIYIDLHTGRIYQIDDLFKTGVDFETRIRELCRINENIYRLSIDGLWDNWTYGMFADSWYGNDKSFVLFADSLRVYTIPSFSVGAISGYKIPYADIMDIIDQDGALWKAIQSTGTVVIK